MTKYPAAMITFYDEDTQTFKTCVTLRSRVQTAIDRAVIHTVEPESQSEPITDEHARLLGAMAFLQFAAGNPELRSRLQITTRDPMNWSPVKPPAE